MNRREFTVAGLAAGASAGCQTTAAPVQGDDFSSFDAVGMAELVQRRQASPQELLEAVIARCERINPQINAVVVKHYDVARAAIAAGLPDGPLRGVPLVLKDNSTYMAGTVTTNGSALLTTTAERDSEIVRRYKEAGLVIFGKTAAPESGMAGSAESRLHGLTRNPWNLSYSAGGSSGGSAAAVAAGILPAAHATDGGGSIRAPASQNGLVGLKPTRGLTAGSSAFGVNNAVSRTVRDTAALLDVATGIEPTSMFTMEKPRGSFLAELHRRPRPLRIAMFTSYPGFEVAPECVSAAQNAARLCESLGHHVEEVAPPVDLATVRDTFIRIFAVVAAALIRAKGMQLGRPVTQDEVDPGKWIAATRGREIDGVSYMLDDMIQGRLTNQMANFFANYDVLLTPTLGHPPVTPDRISPLVGPQDPIEKLVNTFGCYTVYGSFSGIPGVSLPLHWTPDSLPVGVLFQGKHGDDGVLLRLAAQIEEAQPWIGRYPRLAA